MILSNISSGYSYVSEDQSIPIEAGKNWLNYNPNIDASEKGCVEIRIRDDLYKWADLPCTYYERIYACQKS